MFVIKKGWQEVTEGRIYNLFLEVIEEAMDLRLLDWANVKDFPRLFIHKSVRNLGTCWSHKNPDGTYHISILLSDYILDCDDEKIRSVIVHEVGHMVAPGEHHGYLWHVRTNRLGAKWGYTASRLEKDEQLNAAMTAARKAVKSLEYKYELVCPKCNKVCSQYKSMCTAVKYPSRWRHKTCKTPLISRAIGGV